MSSQISPGVGAGTAEQTAHAVGTPNQAVTPDTSVTDTADKGAAEQPQDGVAEGRARHSAGTDATSASSQLTAANTACSTDAASTSQQAVSHQTITSEVSQGHSFQLATGTEHFVSKYPHVSGTPASCHAAPNSFDQASQLSSDALANAQQQQVVSMESAQPPVQLPAARQAETGCCLPQPEDSNSPQADSQASQSYTDQHITCVQQLSAATVQCQSPIPGVQHDCSDGQVTQLAPVVGKQVVNAQAMQAQTYVSVMVTQSQSDSIVKAAETPLVTRSRAVLTQSSASITLTDKGAEQSLQLAPGTAMQDSHEAFSISGMTTLCSDRSSVEGTAQDNSSPNVHASSVGISPQTSCRWV